VSSLVDLHNVDSVGAYRPSKWYLDTRHLAELLDISVGHLDSFLKCIASGGVGKKSDDSWIPNPAPYNTPDCDNILNLHCADVGRKSNASEEVSEPSCSVVEEECTFARLGRVHLHNKAITPRVQREISDMSLVLTRY